jgi:hypothetical protein
MFLGNFNLGLGGISCRNGFKGIVSGAEGVLGNINDFSGRLCLCFEFLAVLFAKEGNPHSGTGTGLYP